MSVVLLSLVKQRLTAAAEDIFVLFERTIAEYEEELSRSKQENERHRKLLDAVLQPQLQIHRADVQQLVVVKEEVPPEQQEWSSSLDQEDPEPPPHIKEEQEELWISQEGEQLQGLEEADITKSTFTPVPVKSEDDEEKPQSSQLHQRQTEHLETEADGEDCGGPEPARNSDPERHLQSETEDNPGDSSEPDTEDSSEPDTEDSADWMETREPNSQKNKQDHVSDSRRSAGEKPFSCSVCKKSYPTRGPFHRHMRIHTGEKPFGCSVCKKYFALKGALHRHMRIHTGEKPFSCSVCKKYFAQRGHLKAHMRIHTGEKPFSCSVCEKAFALKGPLQRHMRNHTGEKPYSCSVCEKRFTQSYHVIIHKCVGRQSSQLHQTQTEENREAEPPASSSAEHMGTEADGEDCGGPEPARNSDPERHLQPETEDNPGDSSEPGTKYSDYWKETREPGSISPKNKQDPVSDSRRSTGEKSFSCSLCNKAFARSGNLKEHIRNHTGDKPFSCSICNKAFTQSGNVKKHMRIHTGEKPFSCSVCKKYFAQRADLKRHVRIHTGEKPFSCSVCEKSFAQRADLKRHMRNHTGEKPFSCSVCDKSFTWSRSVKRHKCVGRQSSQLHQTQTEENREAEPPASSSAEHMETEADGEDCGGPEPARNSDPERHLQPETEDNPGDSC
ncbi:zinc finger protein 2 homolog [Trematomus bernacchii]|uniref:zinc finger protein 2 homolog n=1 Tax=Trematomus bernacchii TaxID=40690 RepID=UPI00146BC9B4|nr:zinc finger protein 2 homolog [Trematomus bernacchii]